MYVCGSRRTPTPTLRVQVNVHKTRSFEHTDVLRAAAQKPKIRLAFSGAIAEVGAGAPMPRNPESERRKKHIVSLLRRRLGSVCRNHSRRSDWYSSEDGTVEVFITDSKSTYRQRPWFDMRDDDLTELVKHTAGFV